MSDFNSAVNYIMNNEVKSPAGNAAHVHYIATRPGVVRNIGMKHGLFGKVDGFNERIENILQIEKLVRKETQKKTNFYRNIISLREEDAISLGFDKKEKWEEYLKCKINLITDEIGIKSENVQWVAAFHLESGHPHVHVLIWDKNQGVKSPYVNWRVKKKIRNKLLKDICKDRFEILFSKKDKAKKDLKSGLNDFFESFEESLSDMPSEEWKRLKTKLSAISPDLADSKILYNKFSDEKLFSIAEDLFSLKNILPKSGRLTYERISRDEELKKALDSLTEKIIHVNKAYSSAYYSYIESCKEIAKIYSSNPENLRISEEKAAQELEKQIGNQILKAIKEINAMESEIIKKERDAEYIRQMKINLAKSLVLETMDLITRNNDHKQAKLIRAKSGELSKAAKKELAIKMEHRSYDWEG